MMFVVFGLSVGFDFGWTLCLCWRALSLPSLSKEEFGSFDKNIFGTSPSVVRNLGNPSSSPSFNTSAEEAHQLKNYLVSLPSFVLQLRRRIVYCGRCCAVLLRPLRLCAQTVALTLTHHTSAAQQLYTPPACHLPLTAAYHYCC